MPNRFAQAVVLVIEWPEEDPAVYPIGNVAVELVSAYPATKWAREEVEAGEYDDYVVETETLARYFDSLGIANAEAAARTLRGLCRLFERTHAEYWPRAQPQEQEPPLPQMYFPLGPGEPPPGWAPQP
jgi:hypothetical protein